jgi:hypothetical protein
VYSHFGPTRNCALHSGTARWGPSVRRVPILCLFHKRRRGARRVDRIDRMDELPPEILASRLMKPGPVPCLSAAPSRRRPEHGMRERSGERIGEIRGCRHSHLPPPPSTSLPLTACAPIWCPVESDYTLRSVWLRSFARGATVLGEFLAGASSTHFSASRRDWNPPLHYVW